MRSAIVALSIALARPALGQDSLVTVRVEQRYALTAQTTPAIAKRRAAENAMAEAVRQVAGVRVRSNALSIVDEQRSGTRSEFTSVVELDAAGRAVDIRVVQERWETSRTPGAELIYFGEFDVTVARERGTPDPLLTITLDPIVHPLVARSSRPSENDEIVATVRSNTNASLALFLIVDDSVQRLLPNEFAGWGQLTAGVTSQLPNETWRARGLHFRVALPAGVAEQRALLVALAVKVTPPKVVDKSLSVLELQRWLVSIPADTRALAFTPVDIRRP